MLYLEELKRGVREDVEAIMQNRPLPFIKQDFRDPIAFAKNELKEKKDRIRELLLDGLSQRKICGCLEVHRSLVQTVVGELKNDNVLPKAVSS